MKKNNLNDHIEKILNDGKAENIVSIPLKGKSSLADYMIIATGTSTRHVSALSNQITSSSSSAERCGLGNLFAVFTIERNSQNTFKINP